jgi:hypothetical protein
MNSRLRTGLGRAKGTFCLPTAAHAQMTPGFGTVIRNHENPLRIASASLARDKGFAEGVSIAEILICVPATSQRNCSTICCARSSASSNEDANTHTRKAKACSFAGSWSSGVPGLTVNAQQYSLALLGGGGT